MHPDKNTAEDFMNHVVITKGPSNVIVDANGNVVPLDELPLDLLPEEYLGEATGEDYSENEEE